MPAKRVVRPRAPLEARLGWTVKLQKARRGVRFVGCEAIARQKKDGLSRALIGFRVTGRGIARAGADLVDGDGQVIGRVTSGGVAPTVGGSIGMAYAPLALGEEGVALTLRQRGKELAAEVVKGPFYKRPTPASAS